MVINRATFGRAATGRAGWEVAIAGKTGAWLVRYSGWFIASVLLATALLVLPIFLMAPTEQASQDPGGPVFDLQEKVHTRFPPRIHGTGFIVEDRTGDILRQAPLWELYQNEERLRDSSLERFLYDGYDADNQRQIIGVFTIADAVNTLLALDPRTDATLATASDDQVKQALHRLFASDTGRPLRDSLSRDAGFETRMIDGQEFDYWRASALSSYVASDNQMLGGGRSTLNLANDDVTLAKERYNRQVQELLRGDQANYRLWGLAIDINLESREQGRKALPFVAATVLLVLVVVGIALRSPRSAGMALVGLLMLFVWLKGGSNLVGLKSSLTLDLIVPIAMISLGVDFFIHAMARYREERSRTGSIPLAPPLALQNGMSKVFGALTLAMLSDGIAFLANVTSGIETVIGFGIAAGIAVFASYIVMGMFLPLVAMRLDQRTARKAQEDGAPGGFKTAARASPVPDGLAAAVMALVRFRWAVLFAAAGLTVATTYLAFQLEPRLDVKEFFDSDSDLVTGLDKLDQHVGPALSGEPAVIYIQGDLTGADTLSAIGDLLDRMGRNPYLGQTGDGGVSLYRRTLLTVLARVTGSQYARSRISEGTGVAVTDDDGDGIPDSREQILATYDYTVEHGVPIRRGTLVYDPVQVRETLFHVPGPDNGADLGRGEEQATIIVFGVLGTRQQANVSPALRSLEKDLEPLRELPSISFAGVTGSPFTRHSTLQAATSALNTSLPVAVAACLVLLMVWMRSARYALVTILPIGLVVSWLYAFMYLAGFHLNFVTATIAAVSIGVGIDYSIHVTQRFRQELADRGQTDRNNREEALRATAKGTGVALAGSAASSVIGFAVLSFSPMPLFSAYGIITAAMIAMAAAAALIVLPSLLYLAAGKQGDQRE
ncbi:MAG: MMPL family transporter [Chloroflexi bacterium]|nr:MMPL family transporter [Chloroflexota bacterium]